MIGMMNCGSDQVEFYNALRQSSLYQRKPSKDSRTYNEEGRVFINGVPIHQESPEEMWHDVIQKMLAQKIFKGLPAKQGGALTALRRLSSKFRPLTRTFSNERKNEDIPEEDQNNDNVTVIRINSVLPAKNRQEPSSSFENVSVKGQMLRRLMRESELALDKRDYTPGYETSIQLPSADSGHASFEDVNPPTTTVVVERF